MATSTRSCAVKKCEIASCAVCHCCQNDLCLDHLREHKDQLIAQFTPFVNQINQFLDNLEKFNPTSLPSFKQLEQWRAAAHETVNQFFERMRHELFEQKKNQPLEKLRAIRDNLDQLIRKQGATRENIDLLKNEMQSIEQEINSLQNIQINLSPLVIDENVILQSTSSNRKQQHKSVEQASNVRYNEPRKSASGLNTDTNTSRNEANFQIFVETYHGKQMLITILPSDTILEIKRKIQNREGIPPEQQRLTYMGKMLRNDYSAATYDIQRQCSIQLQPVFQKNK